MTFFSPKLPLWYQLAALLRAEIVSGRLAPGAQIEPEVALAGRYQVSVVPVRQALRTLEAEGLVVRQRGRGTFVGAAVAAPLSTTSLESLYSAAFDMPAEVLERGRTAPPERLRKYFADEEELAFVRRLAFRDAKPWSYGVLYFLVDFEPQVTTARLEVHPLYRVLEEACGIALARSHFDAQAVTASPDIAGRLDLDPLSPVLSLTAVSFDEAGRAVGAFEMAFPAAPFTFSFQTLHRGI